MRNGKDFPHAAQAAFLIAEGRSPKENPPVPPIAPSPSLPTALLSRRQFTAGLLLAALAPAHAAPDSRDLDLKIDAKSFEASEADLRAVLLSAAGEIWQHCTTDRFEFGFRVYRSEKFPITHFEREDGRIVIGLCTEKTYWSQYAFQFAHEFCHALMDHSGDWRRLWHAAEHANKWVEETLCETGSLFALRAMARTWETAPPYKNWKSFAVKHGEYARQRMTDPKHQLPAGQSFAEWFAATEPEQRKKWTRENNTIIALRLLPLFEAEPAGWDALASLKLCTREPDKTLARLLQEWKINARPEHRPFIEKVAAVFGV